MKILFDERQLLHAPETYFRQGVAIKHPEQPERALLLRDALIADGHELTQTSNHGSAPIKAVHNTDYVEFYDTAWDRWVEYGGADTIAVPNYHISHGINRLPKGIVGQLGYYTTDTACPVTDGTKEAIYWSAQTAIDGANRIMEGEDLIYSLCRPPGHHASRGNSNGFCFFNNAAIAAHHLRDGLGASLNITLDKGSNEIAVLAGIDQMIAASINFGAQAIVVSLGFDMATDDPLSELNFSGDGFVGAAERIMALNLPTLLVQEGGYLGPSLSNNAVRFLRTAEAARKN